MMEIPQKELLTPREVVEYLSVHITTVHRWIHEGKLKAVKVFGVTRIPRKELLSAIKAKKVF